MTTGIVDEIRAAEHRFCEAIDLKVDPNTFDGDNCALCIVGQLVLVDHMFQYEYDPYYDDKEFMRLDAPDYETWRLDRLASADDDEYLDEYNLEYEYHRLYGVSEYDVVEQLAKAYGVDYDKLWNLYMGVTSSNGGREVASNLEAAKRQVVAAYFDCYREILGEE